MLYKFGSGCDPEGMHMFVVSFLGVLPVCPMYASPQSGHVNFYTLVTEIFCGYGFPGLNYLEQCYLYDILS